MLDNAKIDLSVIVPIYNTELFLPSCLDSLTKLNGRRIEIVLVNDGSTDHSVALAEAYARKDSRIRVIHQANRGASSARNTGLKMAKGEYIVFVDSDDWVKEEALFFLYRKGVKHQADVVMGNLRFCDQDGKIGEPFKSVRGAFPKLLSGKEGFIWLMRFGFYLPTPVRYIYRREFLREIGACFEVGIMHEDELWSPVVLSQAKQIVITDTEFYLYRQNEGSVMHTTCRSRRLRSLFRVTNKLMRFANRWTFDGEERELKSWWYVNIFRLYSLAFAYLAEIRDSSFEVPIHYLDRFWRDCGQMVPESVLRCRGYYLMAKHKWEIYLTWRISNSVASIGAQLQTNRPLVLFFNPIDNKLPNLPLKDFLIDALITTDRKYFQRAHTVIFHLPTLNETLESDLDKPEGQYWISWSLASEQDNSILHDNEINALFDKNIINDNM